jgi:kinesin family protein 11
MICVQNLVELQELYNSQQLLTAELSVKLEKTEVRISSFFCSGLLICYKIRLKSRSKFYKFILLHSFVFSEKSRRN